MNKEKLDWVGILGKISLVFLVIFIVLCGILAKTSGENAKDAKKQAFITIEQYYDEENSFQKIVYDPETMVMYAMMDGNNLSPLYNSDGTLKTYNPE